MSLDRISNGLMGWNVIITMNDDTACNFRQSNHVKKIRRCERAKEFVDICCGPSAVPHNDISLFVVSLRRIPEASNT